PAVGVVTRRGGRELRAAPSGRGRARGARRGQPVRPARAGDRLRRGARRLGRARGRRIPSDHLAGDPGQAGTRADRYPTATAETAPLVPPWLSPLPSAESLVPGPGPELQSPPPRGGDMDYGEAQRQLQDRFDT